MAPRDLIHTMNAVRVDNSRSISLVSIATVPSCMPHLDHLRNKLPPIGLLFLLFIS